MRPVRHYAASCGVAVLALLAAWPVGRAAEQPASRPASQPSSEAAGEVGRAVPATQVTDVMPDASFEDLALLVKTARRAFEDEVKDLPERQVGYHPASLRGTKGIIHLTLRLHGAVQAEAESGEIEIVDGAEAAGTLLGQAALAKKGKIPDGGDHFGLEFEWLGPREPVYVKYEEEGRWSDELLHAFEPGVEGIGVEFRDKRAWTRPGQIISLNYMPDLALQAAESAIGLTYADKLRFARDIHYFRFRSHHLWQPSGHELPIVLTRGAVSVPPESVNAKSLDATIERMGEYLHYRQTQDGFFAQEYLPSADRYGEGNSATVQMEALYGLAAYATWSGRLEIVNDIKKTIGRCSVYLRPLSVVAGVSEKGQAQFAQVGLILAFPGHKNYLEISSKLMLIALGLRPYWGASGPLREWASSQPAASAPVSAPATTRPSDLPAEACLDAMARGLVASQNEEGLLEVAVAFQTREEGQREDVGAAGWALSALAAAEEWYRGKGSGSSEASGQIDRVLERAGPHYQRISKEAIEPQAAAALARGFASAYVCTKDARASDTVFQILDQLAKLQVSEKNCPWPELYGAINAREVGSIGVDTADYLSALADGVVLAERIGDKERARRYREVVQAAVRFVMQLEMREEGCYYVRSPRDALGGVRASLWDNRIRADHCAEAVVGLMRAREVLYGLPEPGGRGAAH